VSDYKLLEWDSQFFGFSVARLHYSSSINDNLRDLREQGVKLVYLTVDHELNSDRCSELNGILCDRKVVYSIDFTSYDIPAEQQTFEIAPYSEAKDKKEQLLSLGIQSGVFSRFHVDPNVEQEKFRELFSLWTEKSLLKIIAREVLVVRDNSGVCGMITLVEKGDVGDIGLLAVDKRCRGRGLGKSLVLAAQQWFVTNGFKYGTVVTQSDNKNACHLYEKSGYCLSSLTYVYHLWHQT
jgi:dTDP-4-amino-4,6-dideoxy-D-galactose acyltransferase